jgi:putative hemolysin
MMNSIAYSSFEKVSLNLQAFYHMRLNKIHKFKPKVEISTEVGPFTIKTVTTVEELKEALILRFDVFHKEMIGKKVSVGIDVDEYDFDCDHLIIKEKRTNKIVGTYRLRCSLFTKNFYSAQEFVMNNILQQPGIKLELGRACIHKDYRRGAVISLLWRGIADYLAATDSQFLFGCATVKTDDPRDAALLTRYFEEKGRTSSQFHARPTLPYLMPMFTYFKNELRAPLTPEQVAQAEELLPALCRAYLKIGAFVGGEPAWDREFQCIDFLTILQRDDLNKTLWKRYKLDSEPS